jgi:Phage integrase, N-terminal SAM-like domain
MIHTATLSTGTTTSRPEEDGDVDANEDDADGRQRRPPQTSERAGQATPPTDRPPHIRARLQAAIRQMAGPLPRPPDQGTDRPTWLNAPTTFLTKGDAAAWLAVREAELVEHRWRPAPPPPAEPVETFASYSARWLAARELKLSTVREYTRMLKALVATFGDLPLDEIAAVDIRTWYARLDPAKKTARAHHYALLHTVLTELAARLSQMASSKLSWSDSGPGNHGAPKREATSLETRQSPPGYALI